MKKKIRDITVKDTKYVWCISGYNGDGDGGAVVRVWESKAYPELIHDVYVRAPLLSQGITPKFVRKLILNQLDENEKHYCEGL